MSDTRNHSWVELQPGEKVKTGDVVARRKGGTVLALVIPFPVTFKEKKSSLYLAWRWLLTNGPSTYEITVVPPKGETFNSGKVKYYRKSAV